MTESESGELVLLSIGGILLVSVLQWFLPANYAWVLLVLCVMFIVLIYRAIPAGRGSLDFKAGLLTGCAVAILAYEAQRVGIPMLFDLFMR